jgi:hypothetical protein
LAFPGLAEIGIGIPEIAERIALATPVADLAGDGAVTPGRMRRRRLRAQDCGDHARAMASSLRSQSYAGVISRMPADQNADLFWNRGALAPPESPASIVDIIIKSDGFSQCGSDVAEDRQPFDASADSNRRASISE